MRDQITPKMLSKASESASKDPMKMARAHLRLKRKHKESLAELHEITLRYYAIRLLAAKASSALSTHAHPHCNELVEEIHEALGL